jgi:hypothetical protein
MTYTIWSNCGKYEWLIRDGETIIARSGQVFNSYAKAKRAMVKALPALNIGF